MTFKKWLNTFVDEKGIDAERVFEVTAPNGTAHLIPAGVVIEHIEITSAAEQAQIKDILVKIDFANGDVYHFLNHLAGAIAARY